MANACCHLRLPVAVSHRLTAFCGSEEERMGYVEYIRQNPVKDHRDGKRVAPQIQREMRWGGFPGRRDGRDGDQDDGRGDGE